ncbi:choline kinase family protein [Photobacterium sp. GB-210]|uniref:choline kinase family protein n=1 Tax=Photobacterium sp. GB-210 TaxID=2022104 RepID=UPI000D164CE2|nr:choline kinase family protein [Photobacterium sp. GB-210]PSV39789.1 hypothetical protein C9J38_04450 [Photobacterium sp. GB-210]
MKNKAIILCANQKHNKPVSCLSFQGQLVINKIIENVKFYNIELIDVVVDDYNYECFISKVNDPNVNIIPISSIKNFSLHTLCSYDLSDPCVDSYIIIDGNIIFDRKAIDVLLKSNNNNSVLVTNSRYEENHIINISNDFLSVGVNDKETYKEYLGLFKVSNDLYKYLFELYISGNECSFDKKIIDSDYLVSTCYLDDFLWFEVPSESLNTEEISDFLLRLNRLYATFDNDEVLNIFEKNINKKVSLIEPLGGMTNKNFLVTDCCNSKYVIRIPGVGTDSIINRTNEKHNTYVASISNIDIKPSYFSTVDGVKITPYINGAETLNRKTVKENILSCSLLLKRLHKGNNKFNNLFSINDEVDSYYQKIKNKVFYDELEVFYPIVKKLISKYNKLDFNFCSCHNDTVPENFIKSNGDMYLIDWEYSGLNDPLWDLAALYLEADFNSYEIEQSLFCYFNRKITDDELFRLNCCYIFQDYLWTLWSVVKSESGSDHYDYGLGRFERFKAKLNGL